MNELSKRVLATAMLLCGADLPARESCPVEVKLLLSADVAQTAIGSLGLGGKAEGRVYFFDTDALDLLKHGVILRVRQGASNDLTVKVRQPGGDQQIAPTLSEQFPCEIDRTREGAHVSYSVGAGLTAVPAPETGNEVRKLLSAAQNNLLRKAGVSIAWDRVKRVAEIDATKWTTSSRSSLGRLVLERWKWPEGEILELSAKARAEAGAAAYGDLKQLAAAKGLALSASQDTKTSTVLQSRQVSP
jgi:hypothetical protein